jgi:hypothetical protein
MKRGFVLALFCACQSLPSGVPLANTGGVLDDEGTAQDRKAPSALASATETALPKPGGASLPRSSPAASVEAAPDAGAPPATPSAGEAGTVASPWPGEYFGSDKLARRFEGGSDDVELDDKAHTRVEERAPGALLISIVNSASGETICALRATAHGNDASVDSGQSCFSEEGATATLTDGHAALAGQRLTLDFSGKVVTEPDEDGDSVEFGLDYHFDGTRR